MNILYKLVLFVFGIAMNTALLASKEYTCLWKEKGKICFEKIKEAKTKERRGASNALGRHIDEAHIKPQRLKKKIFSCKWIGENSLVCNYKTKKAKDLRFHICEHTKEAVYHCNYCNKLFFWIQNLLRHQKAGYCEVLKEREEKREDELERLFREAEETLLLDDSLEPKETDGPWLRFLKGTDELYKEKSS